MSIRTHLRRTVAGLGVAAATATLVAVPTGAAHATDCSAGRQSLGNSVPVQYHFYGNTTDWWTQFKVGDLYVGWYPACRQVYAEIHWTTVNTQFSGTVYLNDERNNSVGRVDFSPNGQSFSSSQPVSIDVPPYDQGSQYAYPKSFMAAAVIKGHAPNTNLGDCSTTVTGNTHSFSTGANTNAFNNASCGYYVPFS
ncbi:hypothetical protein [Streptantibioticus ferralitis]|uniref:Tat pathway signal sequence domain protein n=1 Tax=Streptantibioticus ferralitis TaxID=236510 RepID=A0ABT5ZC84_9ACTN|nr:hypothetical protein [Streptantibioticus ferralitis]MDF2261455.1 hypothetical protein [Streptantibioticus ferralitis]